MNKQQSVIYMLNEKMVLGKKYEYSEIRKWGNQKGYKEGTLTSILTKSKGIGAVTQDDDYGLRTRVREITFKEVREYDRTHYVKQSNTVGVSQVLCDKVNALITTHFTDTEIKNILKMEENILQDIKKCSYNVRHFNDMYRARIVEQKRMLEEPNAMVPTVNINFTESLQNLRDAVNETIIAFTRASNGRS